MDNSIYIALSRQLTVFRDMEATANNLANVDTIGYQAEKMMFTNYLTREDTNRRIAFTQDIASYRDGTNGPLKVTGAPFDMAIGGPGFFVVETAAGERYTRAGHFTLNNEGVLVTPAGNPVLSLTGGRLQFEGTDTQIKIGENGVASAVNQFGQLEVRGQLAVVEFEDTQQMTRLNNQLYETEQAPQVALNSRVQQGVLEGSNVSAVAELVRVTELSRSTSSTAKFIEVMYDLQRKTSNTYARQSQS